MLKYSCTSQFALHISSSMDSCNVLSKQITWNAEYLIVIIRPVEQDAEVQELVKSVILFLLGHNLRNPNNLKVSRWSRKGREVAQMNYIWDRRSWLSEGFL